MPTSTDLVTDLPADFEVFGQAVDTSLADLKGGTTGQVLKKNTNADMDFVWGADSAGMTNPMTTTGDTIYSSSGSTPARLGIGSTGQVLTVNGGVPTWAAGGSTPNYALINTGGTALTGAATVTVSGISNKNDLYVFITGLSAGGGSNIGIRFNTDSNNNYELIWYNWSPSPATLTGQAYTAQSNFQVGYLDGAADTATYVLTLSGANAAGRKPFTSIGYSGATSANNRIINGAYFGTSTISSISVVSSSGNLDAGTIYVYGA
jgi:hypothetical protein